MQDKDTDRRADVIRVAVTREQCEAAAAGIELAIDTMRAGGLSVPVALRAAWLCHLGALEVER